MEAIHSPVVIAAVFTIIGGAAKELATKVFGWPHARRDEYREEIEELRTEVHTLADEVKVWRREYYSLLDAVIRGDREEITHLLRDRT